tara:strand:- start:594 stop:1013 length:420 start_codon:yes stop_codon:yes gene_type:complete
MPEYNPIQINPVDLETDVALGVNLPMNAPNGAGLSSTYFTKDQLKANIRSVLTTMIGERVMQPEFGTRLYNFLFEPVTEDLKNKQIFDEVRRCIDLWVPGVSLTGVECPINLDEKTVIVKVYYTIPYYNVEDELTLEVQ